MRRKRADTRQPRNQVGERRNCSPPRMAMVPQRLAELSHAMQTTDIGRFWLPAAHARRLEHQIRGSGRLKHCAAAYIVNLTLVLQKRYFVDHLRLQIVPHYLIPL